MAVDETMSAEGPLGVLFGVPAYSSTPASRQERSSASGNTPAHIRGNESTPTETKRLTKTIYGSPHEQHTLTTSANPCRPRSRQNQAVTI